MRASNSMQQLQLIWLWSAIGAGMLVTVAFVSLIPLPDIGVNDKVSHLLTYFLLAGWFGLLAGNRILLCWTVVALIAYGMIIEWLQGQTGYRYAEWGDVIANSLGCFAGATLYFTPLRRLLRYVDAVLVSSLRR
ncbi:MAG TPA: VanZ family protein [Gammaproteobacteria bacterium]|nr:VanZ family protein [Gammaproteobacteria bacterium]